jgi:hypothetical protein
VSVHEVTCLDFFCWAGMILKCVGGCGRPWGSVTRSERSGLLCTRSHRRGECCSEGYSRYAVVPTVSVMTFRRHGPQSCTFGPGW